MLVITIIAVLIGIELYWKPRIEIVRGDILLFYNVRHKIFITRNYIKL